MQSCLTRVVRLNVVSLVFARFIAFYEELFDKGGSLEGGFCCCSRALSRFTLSILAIDLSICI